VTTPAAGGRRRLTPAERREQLMSAAVAVLAEHGYRDATAESVARRAGVSKGLLWHHFTDLDDLWMETARRTLRTLSSAAGAAIDLTAPAPEVIRAAVHVAATLRQTHAAERRAMREIVLNLRGSDGELRLGHSDLGDLYAAQEAIFRRGQQDGDFRDDLDPRLLAVTYQGAVDSMLGYLDAYPETDAGRHADTVAEVLLGGIGVRGDRVRGSSGGATTTG
jgi:AcrR family transcriptional regulator